MPRKTTAERFRIAVSKLRKAVPPRFPVSVRRAKPTMPKSWAECGLERIGGKRKFLILIDPRASHAIAIDCLVHEWAHCLSWSDGHPTLTEHDETWGVAYSKVYRVLNPDAPSPARPSR